MFSVTELVRLDSDLGKVSGRAVVAVTAAVATSGEALRRGWQANAAATSGVHGKHYPSSMTAQSKLSLGSIGHTVGPDTSRPQGSMGRGFEYGSKTQPPHMDGAKAADVEEPRFLKAVADAAGSALGGL